MTDIKSRLVDGMRGQGIRLPDGDWLRLDDNNLTLIAERLLRTSGIAIVELPEPDSTRYEGDDHEEADRLSWRAGDHAAAVWNQGEVQTSVLNHGGWYTDEPITPSNARAFAAALLAAAVQAQEEQP
jgi:hypothetical protein